MVILFGSFIISRDIQDIIAINVGAHCDLRNTPGSRRNAWEFIFGQQVVISSPCSLTFVNPALSLLGLYSVPGDQDCHHPTGSFQPKREWGDIKKDKILNLLVTLITRCRWIRHKTASFCYLVVGDDHDAIMLPDTDARVRCSEIDSDGWTLSFAGHDAAFLFVCGVGESTTKRDLRETSWQWRLGFEIECRERVRERKR